MMEINKEEIFSIIRDTTPRVKKMLDEKGFSYDIERDTIEKIELISCEISELVDAFKKGLGQDKEGEELADIVIRLLNIPCMIPNLMDLDFEEVHTEKHNYSIVRPSNGVQAKYEQCFIMSQLLYKDLADRVIEYGIRLNLKATDDFIKNRLEVDILSIIFQIITHCVAYSKQFLNQNLQDLINNKMDINFKRPYRFNTSPDNFK